MEQTVTTVVYDTHAAVRRLTDSGVDERQAEAMVREQTNLLEHNLSTRAQVEAVRAGVERLRQETRAEIERLRQETKAEIAAVRAEVENLRQETRAEIEKLRLETKAGIESVRAEVEKLRLETKADVEAAKNGVIMWITGINVALIGLAVAILRFT